jgi:hypothetical protein
MSKTASAAGTCGNLVGAHMPFKVHKLFDFSAIADHLPPRLRRQMTVCLWQEAGSAGGSYEIINNLIPLRIHLPQLPNLTEGLTTKEHDTKKLQCQKCKSTDLEKVIEPFFEKTASKTRRY